MRFFLDAMVTLFWGAIVGISVFDREWGRPESSSCARCSYGLAPDEISVGVKECFRCAHEVVV